MAPPGTVSRKTRIQAQNEELILKAALEAFSAFGFRGATVDQIAAHCGLSKPNLLYYFRRKEDIYVAVLEHTLHDWLEPLRRLDAAFFTVNGVISVVFFAFVVLATTL